ncbi:MAG: hypothetical protein HXY40_11140 [Chloroflexi bacterium]|nr:hypothetical protein [Chloroflexota bacterium]
MPYSGAALRLCARLALLLTAGFVLCGAAVIAFGGARPLHPGLRGFVSGCERLPQPCWYGIQPGRTTLDEVPALLTAQGFAVSPLAAANLSGSVVDITRWIIIEATCREIVLEWDTTGVIRGITFGACYGLPMGELDALFGSPIEIAYFSSTIQVAYPGGQMAVGALLPRHSPYVTAGGMVLGEGSYRPVTAGGWHGYVLFWRYCQLEPSYWRCGERARPSTSSVQQ